MKNFISPVVQPESPMSGSTVKSLVKRAKSLGLEYFAMADQGTLIAGLKTYMTCQKAKIKPILGVQLYIEPPAGLDVKYVTLAFHARTQKAYQSLVSLVSEDRAKKVKVGGISHNLYDINDLMDLSKQDVTVTTTDIESMVTKALLVGQPNIAVQMYDQLSSIFGNKFYPSLMTYSYDKYWNAFIKLEVGGTNIQIPVDSVLVTDKYNNVKASELLTRTYHKKLKKIYVNGIGFNIKPEHQDMGKAEMVNIFSDLPGGDVNAKANLMLYSLAKKYGQLDRVLLNSHAFYAEAGDKVVQDMKLGSDLRFSHTQHMRSTEDVEGYLTSIGFDSGLIAHFKNNTHCWAATFKDFELKYDYRLPDSGENIEHQLMEVVKKVGRMKWDDPRYTTQFKEEFELLTKNGIINLIPYFLPIVDVYDFYEENGYLTGPARGSAGGFLISYLCGITHIDPIKYELSTSRFLTLDRVKQGNLPDIDCDLETRVPLVGKDGNSGFLFEKYGKRAAQVSTRTLLRIKSAILDANRFVNGGVVEDEVAAFAKKLPATPQGVEDEKYIFGYEDQDGNHIDGLIDTDPALKKFSEDRPEEWEIVSRALSIARQNSRHACFAGDTLVDANGTVGFIGSLPKFSVNKPIETWFSGIKDTVIVSMNNGISIQCTPDHKFMVGSEEVEAKDLVGEIVSYQSFKNVSGEKSVDVDMAFALGWFLNDGTYIKSKGNERFEFYFTPEKDDEAKKKVLSWLGRNNYKATPAKDREDTIRTYNLPTEFKIEKKTHNKRLPKEFWTWGLPSQKSFMLGLFSANGYCLSTRPTVAIKLSSKLLISDVAVWLNSNGVETSCSYSKAVEIEHHNGIYTSKSTGTLSIPHFTNKKAFEKLVGFCQTYKLDRLKDIVESAINTKYTRKPIKCLVVEKSEKVAVWDFNEPLENVGYINGILVHNCAYVVADVDIEDIVPIMEVGGVKRVTQPEAKECEWAGLIKYDFLVIKQLQDIKLAIEYINKKENATGLKTGHFMHNGQDTYIWDLPEEPEVFAMLSRGETESIFQLHSKTATPIVMDVKPESVVDCAVITSLGRPGPLDFIDPVTGRNMAEEYGARKRGEGHSTLPILDEMLPETYGVLVFQEQVTKLAKELAGMNVEDSENVRIAVGKKKKDLIDSLKPIFIKGASEKVGEETATIVWDMMETFARYGFNKSHAVAYSVISYAGAYLKHHYKLEWWAATISNAPDKEINELYFKYVKDLLLPPDINTSSEKMTIDYKNGKIRNKLSIISGLGNTTVDRIIEGRPYKDINDFVDKKVCGASMAKKLIRVQVLDSLFEAGTSLTEKFHAYDKAVSQEKFDSKLKEYDQRFKDAMGDQKEEEKVVKLRDRYKAKGPKPVEFNPNAGVSPKEDFIIKKSIFPTMSIDLMAVLRRDSALMIDTVNKNGVTHDRVTRFSDRQGKNFEYPILPPQVMKNIDENEISRDMYFAVPGYVIEAKEFSYKGGTKKAFKALIDCSGYVTEKVKWADYETGELNYPKTLKKGTIAWFFMSKKANSPWTNILDIVVEP